MWLVTVVVLQQYNRAPTPSDDVQINQKSTRPKKGKNFGGSMRRSNVEVRKEPFHLCSYSAYIAIGPQ